MTSQALPWKLAAHRLLMKGDAPHVLTTADLAAFARTAAGENLPTATLTRWVRNLNDAGAIVAVTRGVYLNRLAGPAVHPAQAAQYIRRSAIVSLAYVLEQCGALNNFGDTVTCVVPLIKGLSAPKVGERQTLAAPFRFYALPQRFFHLQDVALEDLQDLNYAYPRATPERALLEWVYLGSSAKSRLPLPPLDLALKRLDSQKLERLAKAMKIEPQWQNWKAAWQQHAQAEDVLENASIGLGF